MFFSKTTKKKKNVSVRWSEFKRHFWAFVLAWMISELSVQKSPRRAAQIKVWMKTSQTNITTNKKFHSLVWARSRYYGSPIFSPSCPCRYLPSGQPHPELPQLEVEHSGSVLGTSKPHVSLVFVRWDGQALWCAFLSHPSSLSWLTPAPVVTPEPLQHIAMTLFFFFFFFPPPSAFPWDIFLLVFYQTFVFLSGRWSHPPLHLRHVLQTS